VIWNDDVELALKVGTQLVEEDGWELVDELTAVEYLGHSWFFSATAFMVDSTVSFICFSMSSGLKSALEAGWLDV
jgi:hypothetical protein